MLRAISSNDSESVKKILCEGLNPNRVFGENDNPLLHRAAASNSVGPAKVHFHIRFCRACHAFDLPVGVDSRWSISRLPDQLWSVCDAKGSRSWFSRCAPGKICFSMSGV